MDPEALRIRTWVNGSLVQDDGTGPERLIFPLIRIIADLSQHFTLEPGDVILTGTPSGSSVVVPGDVVEVEVSTASARTGQELSSGRLRTEVVEGPGDFDADLGRHSCRHRRPAHRRVGLGGGRRPAGRGRHGQCRPRRASPAEPRAKLAEAPTAGLSAQPRARGLNNVVIEGVAPLTPAPDRRRREDPALRAQP